LQGEDTQVVLLKPSMAHLVLDPELDGHDDTDFNLRRLASDKEQMHKYSKTFNI
jgi:hypothetical protein